MAAEGEVQATEESKPKPKRLMGLVLWLCVCLVSIGAGFATPFLLSQQGTADSGQQPQTELAQPTYVDFGEVVVNLNESRLNRYLRLNISLLVDKSDEAKLKLLVEENRPILKSWLLSSMADKAMDDIRGATGQNRLRREIQNHFNSVLCPDGYQRIRNVFFSEFNIQ